MATTKNSIIVAMVPFSRFTHINQLFLLSRFIAVHNIPVHLLCLPEFNKDLKPRLQGESFEIAKNIHFNDILLSQDECKRSNEEDYDDERVLSIMELLEKQSESLQRTCLELSMNTKKLVIIYDSIMKDYLGDVHTLPNVETCIFHSGSAISKYSLLRQSIVVDVDDDGDKLLKQMYEEFPAMDSCFPPGMEIFEKDLYEWDFNSGEFMISSREVEGKYLDLLANAKNKKPLWALGPLHMLLQSHHDKAPPSHECLEFLDNQDVNSVIYVSFGTGTKLSQEQINELAFGLEKCNQRFIWVIGKGDHSNNNDNDNTIELPQGFEERVKGRGMMVRNWVPQLEILGHPSTGGFLSHCGWNSCMESISMGVPIIAWPNEWDQPYNAVLVTKVLKIGISLCNWTHKDELVTSDSIEKSIKVLMDTTEGEEMRKRAVELSNKIKSSFSPGGVTTKEVESFISYITK
ncbi:zeatin O-glucosyltransferase-like [Solanum stenotomum]|uniref:zeatin O-glucosyltransferase-like n=1 Tax=Solanum stenotomum TaxID=172797 RepID=UPI0020D09C13|nr:zeatin O-glucosyltransferase-like [Solanum stenotomum]